MRILTRFELAGADTASDLADPHRSEFAVRIFEPVISGEEVDPAVGVNVECVESFSIGCGGSGTFPGGA